MPAPLFLLSEKPGVAPLLRPVPRQQRVLEALEASADQLQSLLPRRLEVFGFCRGMHQIALRYSHLCRARVEARDNPEGRIYVSFRRYIKKLQNRAPYVSCLRTRNIKEERYSKVPLFRTQLSKLFLSFAAYCITESVITYITLNSKVRRGTLDRKGASNLARVRSRRSRQSSPEGCPRRC